MLRRAFTIVELLITLTVLSVLVCLGLIAAGRLRHDSRVRGENTQVRAIHQALVTWQQGGDGRYPLPSRIDKTNATIPEEGAAKDTTANLLSFLVANGSLSCGVLVSESEVNPHVRVYEGYEYEAPSGAADPRNAMWDPKLSAVLDGSKPGNVSFAHLELSEARRPGRWTVDAPATQVVIGTRAPEISRVVKNKDGSVTPQLANPSSSTLRLLGGGKAWSGSLAFNDNHVDHVKNGLADGRPFNLGTRYMDGDGKSWPDIWCYDEPDDPDGKNDYLGIFLKAGEKRGDFKAAWD